MWETNPKRPDFLQKLLPEPYPSLDDPVHQVIFYRIGAVVNNFLIMDIPLNQLLERLLNQPEVVCVLLGRNIRQNGHDLFNGVVASVRH